MFTLHYDFYAPATDIQGLDILAHWTLTAWQFDRNKEVGIFDDKAVSLEYAE